MKIFLFAVLVFIFTVNEKVDNCNGIENFVFGTPKEQFKKMVLEMEQGNTQLYTIDPKSLNIKGVELDYLGISFIKNKLSAISMSTKNATGAVFFKYLKDKYGTPIKTKNQFEWRGKHIVIILELFKNNKDGTIDFYS